MIGILGGTFDPIHHGHLRLALELLNVLPLQQIRLTPCGQPAHRGEPSASAGHRLAMLMLALHASSGDTDQLVIDVRELKRDGPSYMVDTLRSLRMEFSQPLALIMGWDAFIGLNSWYQWQAIFELAHVLVTHRPGWECGIPAPISECLAARQTQDKAALTQQTAGLIWVQEMPLLDISATQIRQLIRQGHSARYLLPDTVLKLIQNEKLYKL